MAALPLIDTARAMQILEEQEAQDNPFANLTAEELQNLATSRSDAYDLFSSKPSTDRKHASQTQRTSRHQQSCCTTQRTARADNQPSYRADSVPDTKREPSMLTKALAIKKQLNDVLTARKLAADTQQSAVVQHANQTAHACQVHIAGQPAKKIRQSINYTEKGTIQSVQTEIVFSD
jgi:hypothetical protein